MTQEDLIQICHMRGGSRCKDCIAYGVDIKGHNKECNRFKNRHDGKTPFEFFGPLTYWGKNYMDRTQTKSYKEKKKHEFNKVRKELHERYQ